jgi:hypothetical protein
MVVLLEVPSFAVVKLDAPTTTCRAVPPPSGRRFAALPCGLAGGHAGHHETHVRVRRENGTSAGYTYAWLS